MSASARVAGGVVFLYFIIALEVLVMISPFAGFFYATFNPALLFLASSTATRWLGGFFLPHMVTPPGALLRAVRVAGSVLFVGGVIAFLVCAAQVYWSKLARRGPVQGGLYRWIRHPQYLALAATGLGLAILWPRFLTVVLWAVMAALYRILARDEERRMTTQFGEGYQSYQAATGMFLPRPVEAVLARVPWPRASWVRTTLPLALLFVVAVGSAFALRAYTVSKLPIWSVGAVTALPVLPADMAPVSHRMEAVLDMPEVHDRLPAGTALLAYVLPVEYVMQGMIADTDPTWRLYQRHQTLPMMADWIVHPFRHLEGGHAHMHEHGDLAAPLGGGAVRRIIFVRVETENGDRSPAALFSMTAARRPLFFADVDFHASRLLRVQDLGPGTGWGNVPTPMF